MTQDFVPILEPKNLGQTKNNLELWKFARKCVYVLLTSSGMEVDSFGKIWILFYHAKLLVKVQCALNFAKPKINLAQLQ